MSEPIHSSHPSGSRTKLPSTGDNSSQFLACPAAREEIPLTNGWEFASALYPSTPQQLSSLNFQPAIVPGTVAQAFCVRESPGQNSNSPRFGEGEYWFRCRFDANLPGAGEQVALTFGGIATLTEVWFNGESILRSNSMYAAHDCDVTSLLRSENELLIVCRSLKVALRERRSAKPHMRWRTRVVNEQQLRWFRTTLLGRAPGFAPEPEPVGPWRGVALVRRHQLVLESCSVRAEIEEHQQTYPREGGHPAGSIHLDCLFRVLASDSVVLSGRLISAGMEAPIKLEYTGSHLRCSGRLALPSIHLWWPHTHGEPRLYDVELKLQLSGGTELSFQSTPIGFRTVACPKQEESASRAFNLSVNQEPVFARGVVWTPPDPVSLNASPDSIRQRLTRFRDAGFNLVRLAGTMTYETEIFHRLCDELGILVWQDLMFANMDYPFGDPEFHQMVCVEAQRELSRLSLHASTAVICGNSEIEQQVGMLGLDPALGRSDFFAEKLPQLVNEHCPNVPYISSAPTGGELPFRTHSGVANYFGVGAYLRPLEDARRAAVQFASECLAFSNVPEPELLEKMGDSVPGGISPASPAWKHGVPRDAGAGWDFEDVRDFYLRLLYGFEPAQLRYANTPHYWQLSRMVSGEVMAEVFGEWRRTGSPCAGGIILWGEDLRPGAGWGILDSNGWPKAAYWFLKRALAPQTVWMTDEGLNGVDIHLANDFSQPLRAWMRIALYRMAGPLIAESRVPVELAAHGNATHNFEQVLGRFVDASYAYKFGPPGHDLISVSLHHEPEAEAFAQTFRFPVGRPSAPLPLPEIGLTGQCTRLESGRMSVLLETRRFAYGVRVYAAGFLTDDAYFSIEPGGKRRLVLTPIHPDTSAPSQLIVSAVNAENVFYIPLKEEQ